MKSSDERMEIRMDERGKLSAEGKHFATVHPEGKLTSPEGELVLKLNQKGILETSKGDAGEDPIGITCKGGNRSYAGQPDSNPHNPTNHHHEILIFPT